MKRILITMLTVLVGCVLLGAVSVVADDMDAEEMLDEMTTWVDGAYTYAVRDGGAVIMTVDDSVGGDVTIPSTLGGYPVTRIGAGAFNLNDVITSVVIPEGVTSIGYQAFYQTKSLTSVTLPNTLVSIGEFAFSSSAITEVTLPEGLTTIEGAAFRGSKITSVVIPSGVTYIGNSIFSCCYSLKKAIISEGVTEIPSTMFDSCTALEEVTIPSTVMRIGKDAFNCCYKLSDVYYNGDETSRNTIEIQETKEQLMNAEWHYGEVSDGETDAEIEKEEAEEAQTKRQKRSRDSALPPWVLWVGIAIVGVVVGAVTVVVICTVYKKRGK